jgi:hypothetical protein
MLVKICTSVLMTVKDIAGNVFGFDGGSMDLFGEQWQGRHLVVTELMAIKLSRAFPHVDLSHELELCDAWLDANPRRRPRNQYRFLVNWFQKQPKPNPELTVGSMAGDEHLAHLAHFSNEEWQKHLDELDPKRKRL